MDYDLDYSYEYLKEQLIGQLKTWTYNPSLLSEILLVDDIAYKNKPLSIEEINLLKKLDDVISIIFKDQITRIGLMEFYPEFPELEQYILGDIIKMYYDQGEWHQLCSMTRSTDVLSAIKSIRKPTIKTFLKKNKDVSYSEYLKNKQNFIALYPSGKYAKELDEFEQNHKFKLDKYTYKSIKNIVKVNKILLAGIDAEYLIDLKENIAPIYWERISKILSPKLNKRIKQLKRIKNEKDKNRQIEVFLWRHKKYQERLKKLLV